MHRSIVAVHASRHEAHVVAQARLQASSLQVALQVVQPTTQVCPQVVQPPPQALSQRDAPKAHGSGTQAWL